MIERAKIEDFDEFYVLIEEMIAEAEFAKAKADKKKVFKLFNSPDVAVFVAKKDSKNVGFISAFKGEYFFSSKKRIDDLGFYVKPEFRGTRVAVRLIKELENWAKDQGVFDIYLGQTTAINMEKTKDFYSRLGYQTVGFNSVKHLEE